MKRKMSLCCLSFLFVIVTCTGFVFSQPVGGLPGPGGPPGERELVGPAEMNMLGGPGFMALFGEGGRKDLGWSDSQDASIRDAFRNMRPQPGQDPHPPGPEASEAEHNNFRKEMEKRMEMRLSETMSKVEKVMTKEQIEKTASRAFQAVGGFSGIGMNPFAQSALGVTDEQKAKMQSFREEYVQKRRKFDEENRPSVPPHQMSDEERQKMFEKRSNFIEENRKDMETKIKSILTDGQKQRGEKLLAETPAYIKTAIEQGQRGPNGERGERNERDIGVYRPSIDSWQPGQGVPTGQNERKNPHNFPRTKE